MREYVCRYMYVLQHSPLFGSYLTNMSVKFWQEHVQQRDEWQFGALVTCAELSWWRGCWRGQLNVFITRLPARFRVPLTGGSEGCAVTSGTAGLVVVAAEQVEGWQEVPHSAAADAERRRWGCEVYLCVRGVGLGMECLENVASQEGGGREGGGGGASTCQKARFLDWSCDPLDFVWPMFQFRKPFFTTFPSRLVSIRASLGWEGHGILFKARNLSEWSLHLLPVSAWGLLQVLWLSSSKDMRMVNWCSVCGSSLPSTLSLSPAPPLVSDYRTSTSCGRRRR